MKEKNPPYPKPLWQRNDKKARIAIWIISIILLLVIGGMLRIHISADIGFNPHYFAAANALLNGAVVALLITGLIMVRRGKYLVHKKIMLIALILSVMFLASYVAHHLLTGETKFGDLDHNGILDKEEKSLAGNLRYVYYFILLTHIPLAATVLPFILFTTYRALSGNYQGHKKLARVTWPIWMYVAVTGVAVYFLIRPYY